MNLKQFIFVLATFTIPIVSSTVAEVDPKLNFLNSMARSLDLIQKSPDRHYTCFSYYIDKMNECMESYNKQLADCATSAANRRAKIENDTLDTQTDYANSVDNYCTKLKECREQKGANNTIVCYKDDSLNSRNGFSNMHNNATVVLNSLSQNFYDIQCEQNNCTTYAGMAYEKKSAKYYDYFTKCLEGVITVPTSIPETSTIYPTTATTPIAETSKAIEAEEEEENKTESPVNDRVLQSKYISLQKMLGSPRFHI